MRRSKRHGFSLVEILFVLVIIGIVVSMAMPWYGRYIESAKEAECLANRRNIELEGAAAYLKTGRISLEMDPRYACPSHGVYVWMIDSADPNHPRVLCSIHGGAEEVIQGIPYLPAQPVSEDDSTGSQGQAPSNKNKNKDKNKEKNKNQ